MSVVFVEHEQRFGDDSIQSKWAVKVRKKIAVARSLPFERRPELMLIDRQQNEIRLTGVMLGEGPRDLMPGREMDESIAQIVRRPEELSPALGRLVVAFAQDFVDGLDHCTRRHTSGPLFEQQGNNQRSRFAF